MRLTKFNLARACELDDFVKNRFTVRITWRTSKHRKDHVYVHKVPFDVLDDIGPVELAKRIYWVFKQRILR